jgi:hypothetical protein
MKRLLMCTAVLAGGLLAFAAQGQQQQPNPQDRDPNKQGTQPRTNQDQNQPNRNDQNRNDQNKNDQNRNDQNRNDQNRNDQNRNDQNKNDQRTTTQPNTRPNTQPNAQPNTQGTSGTAQTNVRGTGTELRGKVIRSANGEIVVRGSDNREMTFRTNPQTRYFSGGRASRFDDVRVGSDINLWYDGSGNNYVVNTLDLIPAAGATSTTTTTTNNVYEGQVVRVVGNDQVLLRLADGKEITVYVGPQTTYRFNDQPATFNQFQAGVPVEVNYVLQNGRPYARGILGRRR